MLGALNRRMSEVAQKTDDDAHLIAMCFNPIESVGPFDTWLPRGTSSMINYRFFVWF
tara:strand:+ start:80 stop:250 length:171 start_codon:yes stop_codon:yes gene_type:complete